MKNVGKQFEKQVKLSCEKQNILCVRFNDTSTSYIKEKNARFTPKNVADFLMWFDRNLFFIECKSTEYSSMSFSTDPKESKMIKAHQISDLSNLSLFDYVYPCFLFNFRSKDSLDQDTYLMHISDFNNFIAKTDKHSINKLDIVQNGGIIVEQKLLRTNYLYNIQKAFNDMIEYKEKNKS